MVPHSGCLEAHLSTSRTSTKGVETSIRVKRSNDAQFKRVSLEGLTTQIYSLATHATTHPLDINQAASPAYINRISSSSLFCHPGGSYIR